MRFMMLMIPGVRARTARHHARRQGRSHFRGVRPQKRGTEPCWMSPMIAAPPVWNRAMQGVTQMESPAARVAPCTLLGDS
jgi:hypothetical protein